VIAGLVLAGCTSSGRDDSDAAVSPTTGEHAPDVPTTAFAPTTADSPARVPPPSSARDAATRITAIERALRDPSTPRAELRALGWEQQVIYRTLSTKRPWYAEVRASVPDDVAVIVVANVGSNRSVSTLVEPPKTLPAGWRIVAPPRPETLLRYYREAEAASRIPWPYLAAINLIETRMGRIVGDSSAGAQGPMQFIPSSWEAFGERGDVHDHRDAILAAGRYLAAAGGPRDMDAAILAYNHSSAYVDAVKRYASVMTADRRAYLGYYHWQVTYRTVDDLYLLPEGYPAVAAVRLSS
jgi:soluble lytic murein transglycosylase-like protein